ncbi:MAG: hypothetical protein AAFV53_05135 [Myxococcota bacterium]
MTEQLKYELKRRWNQLPVETQAMFRQRLRHRAALEAYTRSQKHLMEEMDDAVIDLDAYRRMRHGDADFVL